MSEFCAVTAPSEWQNRHGKPSWRRRFDPWNRLYWLLVITLLLPFHPALAQEVGEIVSVVGIAEVLRQGRWQPIGTGGVAGGR